MAEDFGRLWTQINTHFHRFNRQEEELEMLPKITKAEFQQAFEGTFFGGKRMDVRYNSEFHAGEEAEYVRDEGVVVSGSAAEFK